MTAGRSDPAPGEAVIPNVLSELTGVGIGEDLFVTNRKLRVVGLSGGTFSMGNPVIFAHASDVAKLLSQFGTVSYLLVDALEGVEATVLARRIEEEVEKVHAMPQEEFIDSDYQIAIQMGAEIVALMSVICSALAVLIVAFISYTQVVHRRRELAIAKALGVSNRTIYVSVLFQTAVITGLAFLLANIVAWLVLPLIAKLMPMVTLVVTVDSISRIGMIAVLTGGVAALIPAYSVARVDPVAAFSS
jgi:putative ABC transport system permease protein